MDIKVDNALNIPNADKVLTKEEVSGEDFSFTLDRTRFGVDNEKINVLMEEITVQGKRLADHMDIRDLKKYRATIKDFVNEVVSNSHKFSRENFLDRRGRHRVYGIVKKVDKNLDDLAQELLKNEKDHLTILNKVDEIRGLLLDIIL